VQPLSAHRVVADFGACANARAGGDVLRGIARHSVIPRAEHITKRRGCLQRSGSLALSCLAGLSGASKSRGPRAAISAAVAATSCMGAAVDRMKRAEGSRLARSQTPPSPSPPRHFCRVSALNCHGFQSHDGNVQSCCQSQWSGPTCAPTQAFLSRRLPAADRNAARGHSPRAAVRVHWQHDSPRRPARRPASASCRHSMQRTLRPIARCCWSQQGGQH
jgi:hypothetical protein